MSGTWVLEADKYTEALVAGAKLHGATLLDQSVTGLERRSKGAVVQTDQGDLEADAVILAMGPWTGEAEKWLGLPVPVGPLKGQILRMDVGGPAMTCSIHYASNYAGPKADGLTWIGTTEERVGFNNEPTMEARQRIIQEVGEFFPPVLTGACRPPDRLPAAGGPRRLARHRPGPRLGGRLPLHRRRTQGHHPQPFHGQADRGHGPGKRRRSGNGPLLARSLQLHSPVLK